MAPLDSATEQEIRDLVLRFFSEECEVEASTLADHTDIIEDLEGDSLMLLALLQRVCKKYDIDVELKTLGRHLMKKPARTIGQVVDLTYAVVEHGAEILNVEL